MLSAQVHARPVIDDARRRRPIRARHARLTAAVTFLMLMGSMPRDAVASHQRSSPAASSYPDIMPLSRVKPGMRGYGLTVFRGTTIERFGVTVVAVVRNGSLVAPGHDMILIRMTGGPMTANRANLIRGMSGSPVYINDRCIGAFSQGEPSAKEPLGGVTPIEDMLEAWDPNLPQRPETAAMPSRLAHPGRRIVLDRPIRIGQRTVRRIDFDSDRQAAASPDTLLMRPCSTMVTVTGLSGRARERLSQLLAPYGVEVAQGSSGGRSMQFRGGSLRPGAAFSAMLLTGDMTSGATGTVTYRRGAKLLGFGHPFLGVGPIRAPICAAYVHGVYPLLSGSYKISTPGPAVGSVLQDRPFCVSGEVGASADTIPITVEVDDRTTGRKKTYRMRAVSHPNLYAGLVGLAVGSAVADMHPVPGNVTARVETVVASDDLGPISRANLVFDARTIDTAVSADLESILSVLSGNPFSPKGIKGATVRTVIEPGRQTATIEEVSVPASRFRPGDTVEVAVSLKPYGKTPLPRTVKLEIPKRCPDGTLTLTVEGGAPPPTISLGGIVFRPSTPPPADKAPPTSVEQMLKRLLERETGNQIAATLALPSASVAVNGEPLRHLPPTLDAAFRSARLSAVRTERDQVRAVLDTPWVVSGRHTLTLVVKNQVIGETPQRPTTAAPPPAQSRPGPAVTSASPGQTHAFSALQSPTGPAAPAPAQAREKANGKTTAASQHGTQPVPNASKPAASADKPIAKTARVWRHSSAKDWEKATKDGVAVASDDVMRLTPTLRRVASLPDRLVLCMVPDGRGGVYAGAAKNARVVHIAADGAIETTVELPEVSVHALVRLPDGTLFVGTGPNGRTYRIGADGKATVAHRAAEPYVLALAADEHGALYIGTGGGVGSVYRLSSGADPTVLARDADEHVLCLALVGGSLYAGTSGRGLLLRINSQSRPDTVLDAPATSVTGIVAVEGGDLLASTFPTGAVIRVSPEDAWRIVEIPGNRGVTAMADDRSGGVLAITGQSIVRLDPMGLVLPLDAPDSIEPLAVAVPADGSVWVGTANGGDVLRAPPASQRGTLISSALDAGATARWGRIALERSASPASPSSDGAASARASCEVHTRVGDSAEPDESWTPWSPLRPDGAGGQIMSRPARYLQYRLTLTGSDSDRSPAIRSVSVTYLPANREPKVAFQSPAGGEQWSGRQTLRWQGSDPDGDTLSFDLTMSTDGGLTWMPVPADALAGVAPSAAESTIPAAGAARAKPPDKAATTPATPDRSSTAAARRPLTVEQVTAELDAHPGLPSALREAILDRTRKLNAEYAAGRPADQPPPSAAPAATMRATSRELDTSKLPDGVYRMRVTATDAPSNWADARTAEAVSASIIICNRAPVVYVLRSAMTIRPDRSVLLEFIGIQSAVVLTAAQWRVDEGDWSAAAPADGLVDGNMERFTVCTPALPPGKHTIELKVYNAAGLADSEKVIVETT